MKYNLIIFFIALTLVSCSKTQPLGESLPLIKTTKALESCEELKIPRDIAFNGNFLYHFSHCVSNKTKTGEESLPGTLGLVDSLGIKGLDSLTTLLLSNPNGTNLTGRTEYPLLRTFLTLVERGTVKNGLVSSELFYERFELLQLLSEKLNPYWAWNLILEMNSNGRLKETLDILSPLLMEEIDMQSLFAMVNITLNDPKIKDVTVSIVDKVLLNEKLYSVFDKLLSLEATYSFPVGVQEKCLAYWLDPLPKGGKDNCLDEEDFVPSGPKETAKVRFERAINKLSDQEVKNLSLLVSEVSNNFITMDSKERLAALKKLGRGSKAVINIQEGPLRNLIGFLEFFSGSRNGLKNVKVSDLDEIMAGLKETIDVTGPDAVKALNQKMGSSKLHNLAEQLMLNGGRIKGCKMELPSLKNADFSDPDSFFTALSVYILPTPDCAHGLSPLANYFFDTIHRRIGLDDECRGPDDQIHLESCLTEKNYQNIFKKISKVDSSGLIETEEPEPEVLKELLLTTLKEVKQNLDKDPYYLHWFHFAEGKVEPAVIDFVIEKAASLPNFNIINLANLDNLLSDHMITRNILREDFLENILNKKIEDLKITQNQFQELFNNTKLGNANAIRLFTGAYFKGPLEEVIRGNLYIDKIDPSVLNAFQDDDFRVAELLGRLRWEGVLINNSRLTPDDSELDYRFLGDKNRSLEYFFNYDISTSTYVFDRVDFSKYPIQTKDLIGANYLRFDKILFDNPLNGVNVKTSKGDEFEYWVKNILYTGIKKSNFWASKFSNPGSLEQIDSRFFDITPYTSDRVRQLAIFYSKNFLFADASFPKNKDSYLFKTVRNDKFPNINLTRLRLPDTNKEDWNSHIRNFPEHFKGNNKFETAEESKKNFRANWTSGDYLDISWKLLPSDRKFERDLEQASFSPVGLEVIKTLSTLDLLTTNRKLKFMPLIGLGKECTQPDNSSVECPVTFLSTIDPNGEAFDAFDHYKDFVFNSFMANYCPLLFKGDGQYQFSDSFYHLMEKSLKIETTPFYLNEICKNQKNLFLGLKDNLPSWYHEQILNDIVSVGENPKLKKGIEGLGIHLKYYKNLGRHRGDPESFVRSLLNSNGYLPGEYLVYYVRGTRDHRGFHSVFPGMLNIYLNYLFNIAFGEGSQIDNSLARYGADVLVNEDLSKGTAQDFLENTVILSQQEYPDRDAHALELIFEILKNLTPRQLDAISSLVAYPQDIESLSNFTGTYSIFLKFLMGQTPSGQFWQRPGPQALKQLMRQETVRAMVDLLKDFNLNEIRRAFKVLHGSLVKNIQTPEEAIKVIGMVRDFLKEEFLSVNKNNNKTVFLIEDSYKEIFSEIYNNFSVEEINLLMDQMVRSDLESFDGKKARPFYENTQALTYFAIKNIFNLFDIYQGHFDRKLIKGKNDDQYLKKLVLSIINPLRGADSTPSLRALSHFIKEPTLGTWKDLFAPILFMQPYQEKILSVLKEASKISTKDIKLGLDETGILLPTAHNTLTYVEKRMNWNENTALEVINAVEVFKRLSVPGNYVWEKQDQLLRNWLTQYEELK